MVAMNSPIPRFSLPILAILFATLPALAQEAPAPSAPLQIVPEAAAPTTAAPAAPGAPEAPATEPSAAGTGAAVEAKPPPVYPSPDEVNAAVFTPGMQIVPDQPSAVMLKLQVLLDRVGISPGVIDGYAGRNLSKAVQLAEVILGMQPDGLIDPDLWQALSTSAQADSPVLVGYAITPEDVAGPFYPDLPSDYAELAKLPSSGYRTPLEMFGERFHMNVRLLEALNPGADFGQPGTQIVVAAVGAPKKATPVASVIADKERAQLIGLDAAGHIVVAYPATIGSVATPSPSGVHTVNAIAVNAAYYYRPDVNFVQGENHEPLTIPPGPNNPIGTTWIDLSEPTYGIHGTPEPSKIDKTNSHGCVRLTNWDAEELAGLVTKGVPVTFQ